MQFQLLKKAADSKARRGQITTPRGVIQTPVFMPVGTQATVKAMTPEQLKNLGSEGEGAEIILGNTYHLYLKPGHETIQKLGGLHKFMNWDRPILTDSGGYQIFSLSQTRRITAEGAYFQSPIDGGAPHLLTPELAIEIQQALDSDIMMVLDECLPYPADESQARESMELSLDWAARSLTTRRVGCLAPNDAALFGIVQGGMYPHLRKEYIERLLEISAAQYATRTTHDAFDGIAIGGLSVGEPIPQMYEMTEICTALLPENKPRYLMGVGTPQDLVECIDRGIDMFDCILPTRNARHGTIFTSQGTLHLRNGPFKEDPRPLDEACECYTCRHYSRAYLRHLTVAKEILSAILCSLHNLHYYLSLIGRARLAIEQDCYAEFKKQFYKEQENL